MSTCMSDIGSGSSELTLVSCWSRLPRHGAQSLQVTTKCEITEPRVPTADFETIQRVHFHIHREQVIATVRAMLNYRIEKYLRSKALTHQPAKRIGKGNNDGIN